MTDNLTECNWNLTIGVVAKDHAIDPNQQFLQEKITITIAK